MVRDNGHSNSSYNRIFKRAIFEEKEENDENEARIYFRTKTENRCKRKTDGETDAKKPIDSRTGVRFSVWKDRCHLWRNKVRSGR